MRLLRSWWGTWRSGVGVTALGLSVAASPLLSLG